MMKMSSNVAAMVLTEVSMMSRPVPFDKQPVELHRIPALNRMAPKRWNLGAFRFNVFPFRLITTGERLNPLPIDNTIINQKIGAVHWTAEVQNLYAFST